VAIVMPNLRIGFTPLPEFGLAACKQLAGVQALVVVRSIRSGEWIASALNAQRPKVDDGCRADILQ